MANEELIRYALLSVGFISILVFIPLMCYLDIRDRKVPYEMFLSIAAINIPVTTYLYLTGVLEVRHLVTSLMICIFAFYVWKKFGAGAFSAADRNLIMVIALFFYWNPFKATMDLNYVGFISMMYQVMFMVFFVVCVCMIPLVIFARNIWKKENLENIITVATKFPRGVPMIIPIAVAFLLAVILGV